MSQDGQQSTLDRTVILGQVQELKRTVEEMKERIAKAEVEVGVLRVGCEVMFHALELNGLLVGGEPARISGSKPSSEKLSLKETRPTWNPEGMEWIGIQGTRGPYERSEDINNQDFKAMLSDLAAHKGKLYRDGSFYWTFPSGSVGRKRMRKA